jgi:hypothetical protein
MEAQINIGEDAGERGGVPPGEHGRAALEVELYERAWLLEASAASSPAPYALLLLLEVELWRDLEDAGECGGVPRSEHGRAAATLRRARGLGGCSR